MVTGAQIVSEAKKYLGIKYFWGGESPKTGFDCSGLVKYVYSKFGINLPHYTGTMINYGKKVERENLKKGDIIFPHKGHVGIYIGNNNYIHAQQSGEVVKISNISFFYAARRLI